MSEEQKKAFGLLFIRLLLGIIFFMQGFGKIYNFGLDNVYSAAFQSYETILPVLLLKATLYFTTYVEIIGGAFLILGLFRNYTTILLSTVLIIVSIGHGMMQPIWDLQHVIFRAILIIPLYFIPSQWDKYCLDNYMKNK